MRWVLLPERDLVVTELMRINRLLRIVIDLVDKSHMFNLMVIVARAVHELGAPLASGPRVAGPPIDAVHVRGVDVVVGAAGWKFKAFPEIAQIKPSPYSVRLLTNSCTVFVHLY